MFLPAVLLLSATFFTPGITAYGKKKCEAITIPLCKGIGYNFTSFPNGYGHEKQEEAGLEVHQFYPLVEVGCYQHLKFFLCAMYTPICQENYDMEVKPCREVCIEARKKCSPIMEQYNFKWPDTLYCDDLPRAADQAATGEICAAPPDAVRQMSSSEISTSSYSKESVGVEKEHKQRGFKQPPNVYGKQPFVPEIALDVMDPVCECRCVRPFRATALADYRVHNVSNCAYACRSPVFARPEDEKFMDLWITVWASICLALSAFTVLTFLIERERFPYPERPIFFLALCQAMVAVGFLVRVYYGPEEVACDRDVLKSGSHSTGSCLLVFVMVYFFGMAACTWWVVLSLAWVLAAVPKWSTEGIAKFSTYFHLFAWLLPALQTAVVIAFKAVDGDPLSGICYVGNTNVDHLRYFVLAPLVTYFLIGVCFLFVGFLNLWSIRASLKKTHPGIDRASKLTQLMSKIGVFSVLYTIPAVFVILALFYEQHYRPLFEQAQLCPCSVQIVENHDTNTILSLIKSASMLIVGWTSGVWVFSGKTLQSWRNFFCCCCFPRPTHQPLNNHAYQLSHDAIPYMAASTEQNTLSRNGYLHHSNGTSPLSKYQQNELMFANRECLSPLIYGGSTLKHCQAMRGGIMPEDV